MRVGLALSAIVHLAVLLVAYVVLASPRLLAPTSTELMTVDIVPADEAPAAKPEPPKIDLPTERLEQTADSPISKETAPDKPAAAEAKPSEAAKPEAKETRQAQATKPEAKETKQTHAAKPEANNTQQTPAAKPGTAPAAPSPPREQAMAGQQMAANAAPSQQPDPFAADAVPKPLYFPMLQNLDSWASDFDFDALADTAAALTRAEIAALRDHLDKCWNPPAAVTQAPKLQAVLRIALKPNGAMAAEPILVKASASTQGPALVATATRALRQCQPFDFLPADKYSEWKILELSFTPRGLGG